MTDTLTQEQADWLRDVFGVDVASLQAPQPRMQDPARAPAPPLPSPSASPLGQPKAGAPADPAVEKEKTALRATHSVDVGTEGGASWKAQELQTVSQAFAVIAPADKAALKGVRVDRVTMIDGNADVAAEYQSGASSETNPATRTRTIKVADGTYVDLGPAPKPGQKRPMMPAPAAEQRRRIVHEVGHVVAKSAQNDADFADAEKIVDLNAKVAAVQGVKAEADKVEQALQDSYGAWGVINDRKPNDAAGRKAKQDELAAMDAKIKGLEAQSAAFKAKLKPLRDDVTAAQKARDVTKAAAAATRVPKATVDAGQAKLDAAGAAADAAATGATAAKAKMTAKELSDSADYRRASDAVGTALKPYTVAIKSGNVGQGKAQKKPADMEKAILAAVKTRDAARAALSSKQSRNPALAALAPVDKAQNELLQSARTQARLPDRPPKIQEFIDIVERNRIPPMTPYAKQSWPFQPEEFFAEAYSFWRTDKSKLPEPLLLWFEGGRYR